MPDETITDVSIDTLSMPEFTKARAAGELVVQKTAPVVEEPEETIEETIEDEQKQRPKVRGGFQKRLERLVKHTATLEEELAAAKKELEASKKNPTKTEEVAAPADGEPQREQFNTESEYIRALTRWEIKQERAEEDKLTAAATAKEIIDRYNKRSIEAQARYEDWEETVRKNEEPIPSLVGQVIIEDMENGPDVAYYLGKHPEICQEMMEMAKSKAVAIAWKISGELAGEKEEKDEPEAEEKEEKEEKAAKVESKAPKPIRPVTGGTTKSTVPLDKMSMADYNKARAAGRVQ